MVDWTYAKISPRALPPSEAPGGQRGLLSLSRADGTPVLQHLELTGQARPLHESTRLTERATWHLLRPREHSPPLPIRTSRTRIGPPPARSRPPRRPRVPRRTLAEDAVNLPNLLTMARVFMVPVCLWFLDQGTQTACFWAAIVFTVAALTDALDGWLALANGEG